MTASDPDNPPPAWTDQLLANPHAVADKPARVRRMFAAIAPSYDLNNRLHSLWLDQHWRAVAVRVAAPRGEDVVLDVACGTGDLTLKFAAAIACQQPYHDAQIVGLDYTYEMLPLARAKVGRDTRLRFQDARVQFIQGDAQRLPLPAASADIVSIAFGIRNVADFAGAIREFTRVLRPGGRLVILEFSLPTNALLRWLYNLYFRRIVPVTATLISGDKTGAYKYLPESVNTFISRTAMTDAMAAAGLRDLVAIPLTCGVCVCYRGIKP